MGNLRDREVSCSASDRQGLNFESCVWRVVSSHSSDQPQEVLQAQFILYMHKGGLKPHSFHFICIHYIHIFILYSMKYLFQSRFIHLRILNFNYFIIFCCAYCLQMSETLVSLNLSNTGVEDEGVKSVTEALTEYSTVEHLVIINTYLLYSSKQNTLTQ